MITYTAKQLQRISRDPMVELDAEHDAIVELLTTPPPAGKDVACCIHSRSCWRQRDRRRNLKRDAALIQRAAISKGLTPPFQRNGKRLERITHFESSPPFAAENAEEHQHLVNAMAKLSGREREIITARYFNGQTLQEIASSLGCKVQSVHCSERRALQHLQGLLSPP
jgi:RNA polymerase sigma factor (sigma-70 family)